MKIIGFNLTKILVEKQENSIQDVKIDQNIDIKNISEEKIPITNKKTLKIEFNLLINYSNNFGKVEFKGNILVIPEGNEFNELLDLWKENKIPENIRVPLFNFIMNKCNVKALYLEDELSLPYHMPMPKIASKTQKENSTPKKNSE